MPSVDVNQLCLGCMNTLPHPKATCPICGWSRQGSQSNASQLNQGITLTNPTNGNEYLIGKAIGQGGFGIVYVAFDLTNNRKVAVKEYFPNQFVTRDHSNTVIPINDNQTNRDFLAKQKKRFYQEAEKMQLFHDSPNVVNVLDYFEANSTAYIVMEFIEGRTFAHVLKHAGRLTLQDVLANLKPIIDILERIHQTPYTDDNGVQHTGITHRDISPENIMYAADGTVKLLDFGAARVSDPGYPPTGIIKPGYAPYEQQLSIPGPESAQGPWTDVYALAATIYRAITGQIPPNALIRSNTDSLIPPSAMGIQITPNQEQVLLKGLAVKYQDRYKSVSQFYNELIRAGSQNSRQKNPAALTISEFTKNGNTYTAFVNYNGDGMLNPTIGTLNGNVLSITSPNGQFSGSIMATEGFNYAATACSFNHTEVEESGWKKIAWVVAAVAVVVAFLMLNKVKAHEIELTNIQEQIQANETKLEKYRDFAADYGYASTSYYSDKAIVFVKRNAEVNFSIYCDLEDADNKVTLNPYDSDDLINVEWDSAPFDENHKTKVKIKAGSKPGYATIKFRNKENSDTFDVLVVVQ